jgi:hypothetical protein
LDDSPLLTEYAVGQRRGSNPYGFETCPVDFGQPARAERVVGQPQDEPI